MVAYGTMLYLVSITIVMFVYTLLFDLYRSLWQIAINVGGSSQALSVLGSMWDYLPAAFLISTTFWYLVQAQRREFTQ